MGKLKNLLITFTVVFLASCVAPSIPRKTQPPAIIPQENTNENTSNNTDNTKINYLGVDKTNLNLKVPEGFTLSIFTDNVDGARDLVGPDNRGNYYLSRTSSGIITLLEVKNYEVINKVDIIKNLSSPHGLALSNDGLTLYFAETGKLSKMELYAQNIPQKIIDLPKGGRHFTRSLIFGPDEKLYISIGSTCDVCYEQDERISTIYRVNPDGSNFEKVASGLRNSVFMTTNPITGEIWATEMGRDNLGDDLPPDEINIIKPGNDYGWPICYGQNIHDTNFDNNNASTSACLNKTPPHIEIPAHSAPLGLEFIPEEGWPEEYANDLLVAFHGSWNRSTPTGYKIVHINLDDKGNVLEKRDFIYGWLDEKNNASGRAVDILTQPGGIAYITDDKLGVVYKLTYNNKDFSYIDEQNFTDTENKINASIHINQNNEILINGNATGTWYFEAIFGIKLIDENNKQLSQGYVTANGEWMTTDYVPFHGIINYENPETEYGYLIFSKANPSGLPEKEFEKRIKVKLK